jgi:hypothetical protein
VNAFETTARFPLLPGILTHGGKVESTFLGQTITHLGDNSAWEPFIST